MTDQGLETKDKIMEVARILFADLGFEGTSVRAIAFEANVNVASVNYHFSNKENLFMEILRQGYSECSEELRKIYDESELNLENTVVVFFRYFQSKSHDLISQFKMMMSSQHNSKMVSQGTEDELLGPPGGKVLAEAILKEVGGKVKEEDLHWAVKCLFSHICHMTILQTCCFKDNHIPYTSQDDLENGIRRLTRVVLLDLKTTV